MTIESTGSRAFSNVTTSIQPCWDLSLFVISKLDLLRILGRFRKSRLLKQACHIQICPEFQIYSHYCPSNNGTGSSVLGFLKPSTITIGWQLSFFLLQITCWDQINCEHNVWWVWSKAAETPAICPFSTSDKGILHFIPRRGCEDCPAHHHYFQCRRTVRLILVGRCLRKKGLIPSFHLK